MNIPVELAGDLRRWRTLDGEQISRWVQSGPWFNEPRRLVVRAPVDLMPYFVEVVRAEVRGSREWGETVRVDELSSSTTADSFSRLVSFWMDVEAPNLRVLVEALGRLTDAHPRLFIVCLAETVSVPLWLDDAQRVLDVYSKTTEDPAVGLLVIVGARDLPAGSVRADVAWPADGAGAGPRERWWAYVHERVAWHAAGSLDVVASTAPRLVGLQDGDDHGLEDALDDQARDVVGSLDLALRDRLQDDLKPATNNPALCLPAGLLGPGVQVARPAPWLARGLLLLKPDHPRRRFLLSLRTCRPLANRLLGRCMDLEQDARDRLLLHPPGREAPSNAVEQAQRLRTDEHHLEHQLSPRGRSPNKEAWDVADFNSVIRLEPDHRVRRQLHRLRKIRNALAHGGEVGWRALLLVDELASELADARPQPPVIRRRR